MRAAFWWIDRWRQSRAFTDMTAEEQGLYRNLLDEVWLRDDHVIPDEPRILAKVSGDPEAWSRCGKKVLRWMTKTPQGWTHSTALEVIGQSKTRAARQKKYRDERRNANDNAGRNAEPPDDITEAPSLGSGSGSGETEEQKAPADAVAPRKKSKASSNPQSGWVAEACDDWNARYGLASAKGGKIGKAIAPLIRAMAESLGETLAESWAGSIRPAWRRYVTENSWKGANAYDFAEHFAEWSVAHVSSAPALTENDPDPLALAMEQDRQADELAKRRAS